MLVKKIVALLLLLMAVGCYENVIIPIPNTKPPLSYAEGSFVQQCFIDKIEAFTVASGLRYDGVDVLVSDRVPKRYIAYYAPQARPLPLIVVNSLAPNHLSGYAHELVRHHCRVTGECDYQQTSLSWTGVVGDMWRMVENLSLEFCPTPVI